MTLISFPLHHTGCRVALNLTWFRVLSPVLHLSFLLGSPCPSWLPFPSRKRSLDELPEKGVRIHGFRFKFWMELASQKPRMSFQLNDLDQLFIWRNTTEYQSCLSSTIDIGVIT